MPFPARLHLPASQLPHVWRVEELAAQDQVLSSGHPGLDAQLPGGGWPVGAVIEVLQAQAGLHTWRLLMPALLQAAARQPGPVILVGAPFEPFAGGVAGRGLPAGRMLCVSTDQPRARLWAAEQSLKCADAAAVLAWLPQARQEELRRLQVAAHQHGRLLFVFRGLKSRNESSPAPVRIQLEGTGTDDIQVRIVKRRGPPLEQPVLLKAHGPRLSALLDARKRRSAAVPPSIPQEAEASPVQPFQPHQGRRSHVLDRIAALH